MIRLRTKLTTPLIIAMALSCSFSAHGQVGIDANWGTNASTFNLNCISTDCGGGGVSGGDAGPGNLDDNVQGNPATSSVSNSLGSTTVTADFVSVGPGLNSMIFTGSSTSSTLGISEGSSQALGLYTYAGPDIDLTVTITLSGTFSGPTSGEDNNIDGISGRVLLFTSSFAIDELNFETGANLTCLFECYSPNESISVELDSGVSVLSQSVTISLTDGDQFYMHGQMNLGSAGGGAASTVDGVEVTFSTTAGLTSVPGGSAPIDTDADGIADDMDNCTLVANADQRDTNADGYGNICDPDLNNDGIVNFLDVSQWVMVFNTATSGDEDLNGDDFANFLDFSIIANFFLAAPGPSGVAP